MYQASQEGKEHGAFWLFTDKGNTDKGPGHGGKSISLISKAHEKLNPKSL